MHSRLQMSAAVRRQLMTSAGAGLAGFALNCFPVTFAGSTHLTLGGVCSLAIALTLGPVFGALTAFLAELPGLVHPAYGGSALLLHVLEAATVGFLVRRRVLPLFAIAIYWCIIGMPAMVALESTKIGIPVGSLWAVASKNVLNALLNVTLADALTGLQRLKNWLGVPPPPALPLRKHLARGFMLASAGAFLALSIALSWVQSGRLEREAGGHLQEAVARVTAELNNYIDRNQAGLIALEGVLDADPLDMNKVQARIEQFHAMYPSFRTLAMVDMGGRVAAADPEIGANGRPVLNMSVADRDYFKATVASQRSFVSDVFL